MENAIIAPANEHTLCDACHANITTEDTFCNNCGYPLKGTEQEQKDFITQLTVNEIDLADYKEQIKKGGNSLYYVAGAVALGTIVAAATETDQEAIVPTAIIMLIVCGIFVFLGSWARKKPFAALVTGSVLYALIVIGDAVVDPTTIIKGIVFKIFIVVYLYKGLTAALAAEKIKKETHLT